MGFTFSFDENALGIIIDHNTDHAIGTGFYFLKPEWIVTAKHVVITDGTPRQNLGMIFTNHVRVRVCFLHPAIDLAVLQLEGEAVCKTPLYPSHERFTGTNGLVCCGYAPSLSNPQKKTGAIYANQILSYDREIRNRNVGDEEVIAFEASYAEGGHSGGPIFGEGGGVVGVMIETFLKEGKTHARATGIHPLLEHLSFPTSR